MTARHVLVFPSWYPADAADVRGVFFRDQALALRADGHKVGVVAVGMRSLRTLRQGSRSQSRTEDGGIPTYRDEVWAALPRVPHGNYWLWRRVARRLFSRYVRGQGWPDVIHAHASIYAGAVAAELGREYGIPVVLTEHSSGFARRIYRPWQWRLAAAAAEAAALRITVSPGLGELLGRELATQQKDWIWVPNVVAERFMGRNQREREGRGSVRFLNLALMTPNKGQADLLTAFAQAFGGQKGFELWLGGDGPIRSQLETRARELGLDGQVRFLGRVEPDAVPALLGEVDVMVIASHYETFGVVAAEALMAGRPVVATRCGGPECIVGEDDGLLVEPRAPDQLAQALRRISDRLDEYPANALAQRARARFGGAAVAKELTAIYEDVIREHASENGSR